MSGSHDFIVGFRNSGRKFLDSAIPVLEMQRDAATVDLYEPAADEVVGGLFARVASFRPSFLIFISGLTIWARSFFA
jgi:hypothetical protein